MLFEQFTDLESSLGDRRINASSNEKQHNHRIIIRYKIAQGQETHY